jgi:N12 class adenine-specific DNA methylase
VWRIIQTGNTYLAHAVGAGKTAEQIISGMEQKRLGLIKKPMYVVPNHMLQQFAREFLELYPAANIMVADEKAFHTDNRRRFMAQAALNDPDAIIVTHSAPSASSA